VVVLLYSFDNIIVLCSSNLQNIVGCSCRLPRFPIIFQIQVRGGFEHDRFTIIYLTVCSKILRPFLYRQHWINPGSIGVLSIARLAPSGCNDIHTNNLLLTAGHQSADQKRTWNILCTVPYGTRIASCCHRETDKK
jgi:hypothetical protein